MGLWSGSKKAAKVAFVTIPSGILGVNQIRMGNQFIGSLWRSLRAPACPECERSIMAADPVEKPIMEYDQHGRGVAMGPWTCVGCGYSILAPVNPKYAAHYFRADRNARVREMLGTIGTPERERLAQTHRRHSRAYFVASALVLIGALYMIAISAPWLVAINWLIIAFPLWLFGMTKSYRAWQVLTGTVFREGAFAYWLRTQKWLV